MPCMGPNKTAISLQKPLRQDKIINFNKKNPDAMPEAIQQIICYHGDRFLHSGTSLIILAYNKAHEHSYRPSGRANFPEFEWFF